MKLDEIAKLAGVSRTTASYVINGKAAQFRISIATQKRVLDIVKQYNYQPNPTASALRAGMTRSFGLIIPDLENTSYAKIAKLLEYKARNSGYQMIISCSDDCPKTEKNVVKALINRKIDALIIASSLSPFNDFYPSIQASGIPIIAIDRALNDEDFACVISEDLDGAYQLTTALIKEDTLSVGLIGAMAELGISKEREQGFFCAANKTNAQISICYGEHFSQEEGKRLILNWYHNNTLPQAILTTSYSLFEGVLDAILDYPQISQLTRFATFGDNRMLNFIPIKVHSLTQQFALICDKALSLTLSALSGNYQKGIEVIPRKPILRE